MSEFQNAIHTLDKIAGGGITKVNRKLHTTNRSLQTILS